MMKKLALNLLKSADEKLRNISAKQSNKTSTSGNSCDTSQNSSKLTIHQKSASLDTHNYHQKDSNMSDRGIQKTSATKQHLSGDQRAEVKRRTRSEGPAGRIKPRNSMDEKKFLAAQEKKQKSSRHYQRKKQQEKGLRHSLYTEPLSDEGGFPDFRGTSSESESDNSETKQWVKNPLIIKKQKRSEKRRSSYENETGGKENDFSRMGKYNQRNLNLNRNIQEPNREAFSFQDKNGNAPQKAKYQKLEELRKKRIDITVTSDEELNSPEFRISRLRQRALQGAKMSSKLPDMLEDWNTTYGKHESVTPIEVKQAEYKRDIPAENGSSSSEQITLRQIGPGFKGNVLYNSDQTRRIEITNNKNKTGAQEKHRQSVELHPGLDGLHKQSTPQGSYRKIPKQEKDYCRVQNTGFYESDRIPGKGNNPYEFSESYKRTEKQQTTGSIPYSGESFSHDDFRGQTSPRSQTLTNTSSNQTLNFHDVQTNNPVTVKKAIDRVDKKRKSNSDDDSLDDLIESNIQYLESEIESGKLKKLSSNQPVMFPVSQRDNSAPVTVVKKKSTSWESVSRPEENTYQNEVRLRLQIPVVSQRITPSYAQYQTFDSAAHNQYRNQSATPPSGSRLNPTFYPNTQQHIDFQNTVPKTDRKYSSATHSPQVQRRCSDLSEMEDLSKSDSQINISDTGFCYQRPSTFLNPQFQQYHKTSTETRQYTSHLNNPVTLETMLKSNSVPAMESGMFSDVDYDIEVSDRIKKWENYMKKKNVIASSADGKQAVSLSTIVEGEGGIPPNWENEHETAVPIPQTIAVSSVSVTVTKSTSLPASRTSPPPQITTKTYFEPKVKSTETNSHRIFRVVQDPRCSQTSITPQENTVNWVHSPLTTKTQDNQIQKDQMFNEEPVLRPNVTSRQGWPPSYTKPNSLNLKIARLSRFEDEFNELQDVKAESVKDLRKKFDSDASGNESTDVTDTPTTPVRMTPLRQRKQFLKPAAQSQQSKQSYKAQENIEKPPQPPIRVYERKMEKVVVDPSDIKPVDKEVWSPNLESNKGLISIERVKARTLQTIPFSEDPIWKQIEEMTNIDQLAAYDNLEAETMPHIPAKSYLPYHRNSLVNECSSFDQTVTTSTTVYCPAGAQQARPFITPEIQPLKLSVKTKSSVDALDEVLEDIRTSLQKKQINPCIYRTKQHEMSESTSSQSPSVVSKASFFYTQPTNDALQPITNKNTFSNSDPVILRNSDFQPKSSEAPTYSLPRQSDHPSHTANQLMFIDPDFTQYPYIINGNYQLDPNLLKERLLDTGLAEELSSLSECDAMIKREPPTPPERRNTTHSQVLQSMEDLRKLAEDVEHKLREIKTKIIQSDENKLDSIILALRKFSPCINPKFDPVTVMNKAEHSMKREKLKDALSELERIYDTLELDSECLLDRAERREYATSNKEHNYHKQTSQGTDQTTRSYPDESVAEVERQTQKEFDDINKSFQSLLADFSQTEDSNSDEKSNSNSQYVAEIDATIGTFLEEFRKSESKRSETVSASELKKQFSRKPSESKTISTQNTCREVMKPKVFTANSGPFSVLVGLNSNRENARPASKSKTSGSCVPKLTRSQSDSMKDSQTINEQCLSSANVTTTEHLSRPFSKFATKEDGSESDEACIQRVPRRFGRNTHLQHRKSMPADMLKKSVETQTVDPDWVSPVAVMREKFQVNKERDDSVSSESSNDIRGPRRRRIAKGIAMMMEMFSSSEDEPGRKNKLSHSHSAPDLRDVFNTDTAKPASPVMVRTKTPRAIKQRHEARARKKSTEMCQRDEKTDEFSVTSATSDDGSQMSGTKPPLHPGLRKQKSFSPERSESINTPRKNSASDSKDNSQTVSDSESKHEVLRRKNKERSESPERPHSFHELLTTFERDPERIDKLRHSLRKCASADEISEDMIFRKSYSSEPDLSKVCSDSLNRAAKLNLEIRVKS